MSSVRMNIAISINSAYIMPLKVMLFSLAQNTERELHIHLLYSSLNISERKTVRDFIEEKCHGTMHEILVDEKLFIKYMNVEHSWSVETFYRLLLPYVLASDVERVLWMDADMVVCGNIDSFYDVDMGSHYLCGVPDRDRREHAERLDLDPGNTYFNAGMLLFNLIAVRKDISQRQIFAFLKQNRERLRLQDQDVLNCLMGHNALLMDERIYNNQEHLYGKVDFDARVIHYASDIKPWQAYYCGDRYVAECFWKYACRCGFRCSAWSPVCRRVTRFLFSIYVRMKPGRLYAIYHKFKYGRYPWRG